MSLGSKKTADFNKNIEKNINTSKSKILENNRENDKI